MATIIVPPVIVGPIYDKANSSNVLALAGNITANAAYDKANAANSLAYNTGIGSNAYADAVGTSANAFTSSTIAGANAAVGSAANSYAGQMANAVNSYTSTILSANVTAANSYAGQMANAGNIWTSTIVQANVAAANAYSGQMANAVNTYTSTILAANIAAANAYSGSLANTLNANVAFANTVAVLAYNYANTANLLAYNTGIGANAWSNTKLSNTTGATFEGNLIIKTDLTIGNNIQNVTSIVFNTGTNRTPTSPGELTWSQDDSALHFGMNVATGVVGHIGQDVFFYVKNQSGATITKGTIVRFAGTVGASGRLLIAPAIANNSYPSKYIIGVVAGDIAQGADGFVISQGKIRGLNMSSFSAGDILYVSSSTPGAFSNVMPTAPNNKITVAAVISNDNINGTIQVRVTYGSKLAENENAELSTLTNSDILEYIAANGRFENTQTLVNAYNKANSANYYTALVDANTTAAFSKANAALPNTTGTFAGALTVSGYANANNITVTNYFDITPRANADYLEGRLYYSSEEKTWVGYGDYTDFEQTLGEREWVRCRNSTANTILRGKAVYVTGVHIPGNPVHGHHPTIELADCSDINKKDVLGIAGHDIPSLQHGYVVIRGYVENINTSTLTSGTRVHLGYNGNIVNDAPEYPNWPMDVGICLTSNTTNGTLYVTLSDHSMERLRVQYSARVGGDLTVEGDLNILGSENRTTVNSLQVGTQFIYLGSGDSIPNANIYFTGSGLNDLSFKGHYEANTPKTFYVKITDVSPDKYSWSYLSDFSVLQQQNVVIQYQTSQLLANGISVYFQANTGHTKGDKWNASAFGISSDFGFVGNHIDGPNGYTHAGLFRDATDGTFKFFRSYDPEINGNVDIGNTSFAYGNVQAQKITANEIYENATKLSDSIVLAQSDAQLYARTIVQANVTAANTYAGQMANAANIYSSSLANTINANVSLSTIAANNFASATIAGANSVANGWANTIGTYANNFTSATIAGANSVANGWANTVAVVANNWANTIGTYANNFTSATIAGANSVANGWANTIGTYANNFASATIAGANSVANGWANTIGTYANNWANTLNTTIYSDTVSATRYLVFSNTTSSIQFSQANVNSSLTYNPSTATLNVGNVNITGTLSYISANSVSIGDGQINSISVTTSTTTDQIIDTFLTTDWRSANYIVSMNAGTSYQTTQISLIHDGTNVYMTEYGMISNAAILGTFSSTVSGTSVRFNAAPTNAVTTIRLFRTTLKP